MAGSARLFIGGFERRGFARGRRRDALNQADDLAGEEHRQQRTGEALQRQIRRGQREDNQIAAQIDALNRLAEHLVQRHGQRVVAAGRAARANAQPRADADKQRADDRRDQRHLRQTRPERIKPLKKRIERGEAAARDDGIEDERAPQRAPAADVAGRVEHKPRNGGGKAEPVVQQQRHAQHAALGDVGKRMNIVQAEGENGTARERQKTFAQRKIRPKRTQNKTPFQNIVAKVFIL